MVALSSDDDFDEARFQAHLALGTNVLQLQSQVFDDSRDSEFVSLILHQLKSDFNSGFSLSTGLSMETLWNVLRPVPIPDKTVLDWSLELDRLAARFDAIRWKANASIPDLSKAQKTLETAYEIVRTGHASADELVTDLTTAIESLEARIGDQEADLQPFLSPDFESLRQISMLRSLPLGNQEQAQRRDLVILSSVPTKATMSLASSSGPAAILQSVDCLVHQDIFSWNGKLATSLWHKLQNMGAVSLRSLALLESELPALGRCISELSAEVAADPVDKLNDILWQLLLQVFAAHSPHLAVIVATVHSQALQHLDSVLMVARAGVTQESSAFNDVLESIDTEHLRHITRDHLIPSIVAIAAAKNIAGQRAYFSALAWIHFSMGLVKLYVPDRVFDPQLRPRVELEFFESLQMQLHDKISALKKFERKFTGQDTSVRIELLEEELSELGPPPAQLQPVFRPEVSELSRLHAEFSNVLKTVTGPSLSSVLQFLDSSSAEEGRDELRLIKENVQRLVDRLSARFEAYQDMTRPAVNTLRCLLVGLSLCDAAKAGKLNASTEDLARATPFFGGLNWDVTTGKLSAKSFEYLKLVSARVAVEGVDSLPLDSRESVFECFHSFYDDWNKKLEADRKAEKENTSLYRFRGTFEDEEEFDAQEFNELFPSYDEEDSTVRRNIKPDQVRDMSLKVAEAHKKIFLERQDPSAAIREVSMAVGQRISNETRNYSNLDRSVNGKLLATTMLLLNEKLEELQSSSVDKTYNFYTDANLSEARQLVSLAHKIKARFRELQLVDEIGHMQPLADVVQSCDKLLDEVHTEPLAKLLPKVEQLHTHVYEWQFGGWASKVYAVLPLHDSLTDTVIRWRRIELSTWANLFDMEQTKCQDDAYSWWFIAYQVVVAVPLSMVDSLNQLREYAASLIQNLEMYFSTSIVGQFKTRVALLRQLLSHLRLLVKDYPTLDVICCAVKNFIDYYARYEHTAGAAIQRGRTPIEKKMKDVLLMASWKDTNINALRESARKSHQKLFRLVRKFRAVLGQEMRAIIAQGLPDEEITPIAEKPLGPTAANIPDTQPAVLNEALPGWLPSHRRLANVSMTVSVLNKIAQSSDMMSGAADAVNEFVSGLNTAMAELRKETPTFLNDENKDQIKHLKTRKRKLFADTLRDLRKMGLKFNLGQDKLAEQESLAVVLASTAPVELPSSSTLKEAEYLFHKTLDLAPKARVAAREHSEDLTGAEAGRSLGFVEGMINFALIQRSNLAVATKSLSSLQAAAGEFQCLGDSRKIGKLVRRERDGNWSRLLPWLAQILQFATRLVQAHARLGQIDNDVVVRELQSWSARVGAHLASADGLGKLPTQLASEAHMKLEAAVANDLEALQLVLDGLVRDKPSIAFILHQLHVWTQIESQQLNDQASFTELKEFANAVSTLTDTILVAVESAKKKSSAIPKEEEEAGWLKKHNDSFFSMINKLHMKHVEQSIRQCIQLLQQINVNEPQTSAAAMSIVGLATPVLDQFSALCCQSVERGMELHRATINMAYNLTKTFTQLASQGFCTPQEKSDETSGDGGQLESGTGLGEGEGAEDISKDIQPDEDLSELAQEANKEESGEIEDEKDAVDMADEDMEGEMGSVQGAEDDEEGSQKGDEEEDNNDMDEEAGDVDDLDPTAVDEKMWDGDDEKADKDQQGDKTTGQKQDDEQMAAEENDKKKEGEMDKEQDAAEVDEQQPEEDEAGEENHEEEDVTAQEELNRQDQNVEENDALELPEEMDLDFNDQESVSSDGDDLDLISDAEEENKEPDEQPNGEDDAEDEDMDNAAARQLEQEAAEEDGEGSEPEVEDKTGGDEVQDEVEPEKGEQDEEQAEQAPPSTDNANAEADNAAPSDVKSSGLDQNADSMDLDEQFQAQAAKQEHGDMGDAAADQDTSAGNQGATSRSDEPVENRETDNADSAEDSARSDPFRKLGDALEKWHRQQADIKDANPDDTKQPAEQKAEADQGRQEFQHLQDDEAAADTQAMGTADDEEVQPINESMAVDEEKEDPSSRVMNEDREDTRDAEPDQMDLGEAAEANEANANEADNDRSGVKTRQGNYNREASPEEQQSAMAEEKDDEGEIEETSTQLSTTHISDEQRPLRDYGECMRQWSEFQSKSHALSLSLTSQLRLILTPSQSTKLSGSFRTGKRLNIKRIIPYIASSYKRDKIWMRRSVPTKRTYQILLCVDDSKSMGESSSGSLAMESLVMVSRSLTMLEAGQVGVVGFGSDVFTAHELTDPFASDAGAKVLQKFSFSQDRTDIAQLIRQTIDTFRMARQQSGGSADLWQLALILSDGLTPSSAHDSIRRLLREAMEDRIMIVFIIMDDTGKKKGDSVLELKEAKFVREEDGESRVVIERYLDTFPFQYYLIVHNLEELPSALAGLLRTWFAEVAS